MNLRRLYILLAVWCVLVIAPGALMEAGVFGRIDMNSDIPGMMIVPWLVGYLAQFAIFMWMMNMVGEQKILWWFAASLLPWAADWTIPVSPFYILLWVPTLIAIAYWIGAAAQRAESLQRQGIRATGVVLEVLKPWMNVVINNVYIRRKVRLRIEREDGVPAYEGMLKGLFMLGEIPSPGDRLALLVDPAKPQRFDYDKASDSSPAARVQSAAAASAADQGNFVEDLEQLTRLHDRGAITDAEFAAAKKKLLRP
jgi:hypothetical protein